MVDALISFYVCHVCVLSLPFCHFAPQAKNVIANAETQQAPLPDWCHKREVEGSEGSRRNLCAMMCCVSPHLIFTWLREKHQGSRWLDFNCGRVFFGWRGGVSRNDHASEIEGEVVRSSLTTKVKGELSSSTCCSQGPMKEVEMNVMQQAGQHGCSWRRTLATECHPAGALYFIDDALINSPPFASNLKHLYKHFIFI